MADNCPVCLNSAEHGRDQDYGERKQVNCFRCGPFGISRSALAILSGRVRADPRSRARLSHSIRSSTSEENLLFISTNNLDDLLKRPLPGISTQVKILITWIAAQLRDDRFGRVPTPSLEMLAGLLGTNDGDGAERLVLHAIDEKMVDFDTARRKIGITPKGWAMIETDTQHKNMEKPHKEALNEVIEAYCNFCSGNRNAYRRASYEKNGSQDHGRNGEISWSDTYDILECCGCENLFVRHTHWFSEWDDFDQDPVTGENFYVPGTRVAYFPPETRRKLPEWCNGLEDDVLRNVLEEIYKSLNTGLIVLASIGVRTLLDRAMFLRIGDPKGGFSGKLSLMMEKGHIGLNEKSTLEAITDAGNASTHRGFAPNPKILDNIMSAVENFLHREYILKTVAGDVRSAVPPRPPST